MSIKDNYFRIILPTHVVSLTSKIAHIMQLDSVKEIAILCNLQHAVYEAMKVGIDEEKMNEKWFSIFIANVIRHAEKMLEANSRMSKVKLGEIFEGLNISSQEFDEHKFEVFKQINFSYIGTPEILVYLNDTISTLPIKLQKESEKEASEKITKMKDEFLETSLDIMKLIYMERMEIYKRMLRLHQTDIDMRDWKIFVQATVLRVARIYKVADRQHFTIFDHIFGKSPNKDKLHLVNNLSMIILDLINGKI